ncbi:MAG: tripartite tricarboxylate transporter substrate binding protein [Rubrivivax sp.]
MNPFRRAALLAVCALLPVAAAAQTAAAWPAKPIRVLVPVPAGGQTDAVVRYYAQKAEASLGQPFVIENKPGVNTMLATQEAARAPADGYTLLFNMTAIVSNAVLLPNVKYDPFKDFAPVHRTYELYAILAVPGNAPIRTLPDFVAAAKTAREPMTFGTTGHASSSHYFIELLAKQAGVSLVHVPYKGEAPLLPDLMSNRVQAGVISGAAAKQFDDGRVRVLAVSGNQRLNLLPNLPTFKELGYQGIGNESFAGFFAPAGTPPAVVERLNREFNRISQLPETRERLAALALEPTAPNTPAEFLAVMRKAHEEWVANSKAVDIKPQ